MKVVGYINTNGYFPSPLTILTLGSENDYFLHYPNGERYPISCDQESIDSDTSVFRASPDAEIGTDGLAYGFNEDHVVLGSGDEVRFQLAEILSNNDLDVADRNLVCAFLEEYSGYVKVNKWEEFEDWPPNAIDLRTVKSIGSLSVYFSDRIVSVRGRREVAKRLLVQFDKNGSLKTAYRKNLRIGTELVDPKVPYQAIRPFW